MLKLRNTLTGMTEVFRPLNEGRVHMYACGLTVYDYGHIGNFRTFIFVDLLRRYLKARGYQVLQVMNFTDVDDNTIGRAAREGIPLRELTDRYIQAFADDMRTLNAEKPEVMPRATDHIPEMVSLVKRLMEGGFAYEKDGSIYFRVAAFPGYGKLSKINLEGNIAGARVDTDKYDKTSARDFVLWKAPKFPDEPQWQTDLGPGRPGWHLECSAMSMRYLGETFDLHCGGVDLIFPHHENEIAQSECATGKPFVRYWLHAEFLQIEEEKMSKSLGNYYTPRDLLAEGFKPMAIRYALLSVPYRRQMNFTFDGLRAAEKTLDSLLDFRHRVIRMPCDPGSSPKLAEAIAQAREEFNQGMDDDLNTARALSAIHTLARAANIAMAEGAMRADDRESLLGFISETDRVLGVLGEQSAEILDAEVQALIEERDRARAERNFARSDEIRKSLADRGILLEDTKTGIHWRRK